MPDIDLMGAVWPDVPAVVLPVDGGGTARFTDVSSTTAVAGDVASGKTFFLADGSPATGSAAAATLKWGVLRPDATVVKTYSYDKWIVADEKKTLPSYNTTAQTLLASSALAETYTVDYGYKYYILVRCLTYPTYSISSKAKGRFEWGFTSATYEVVEFPGDTFYALLDTTKSYASRSVNLVANGATSRVVYWSSETAVSVGTTSAYGTYQTLVAPAISSGVITFNTPNLMFRGSTTYLVNTYMNAVTDIRYQWIIEVWREPKGSLNIDGYNSSTHADHIIECMNGSSHKLT